MRKIIFGLMKPYLTEIFGNASSPHRYGQIAKQALEESRRIVAEVIGAKPEEIIFTSGGTESDNLGIKGAAFAREEQKGHIITSSIEHSAVLNSCRYLEGLGFDATFLPVNKYGQVELGVLEDAMRDDTFLVSIGFANHEIGTIQDIAGISKLVHEKGALLHTDAVQGVSKVPINVKELGIDLLSLSGHKIYGPKGVGALYVRKATKFTPFLIGGHQEHGRRGGTENVASIVGLGKACQLAGRAIKEENTRIKKLRDRLEKNILEKIPHSRINGMLDRRLPNTTNIGFEFVEGEATLLMLDEKGIAASSGSACTSGSLTPSHVLRAMGAPFTFIQGSIRFSLSRYNTDADIDYIIKHLPVIIERLRKISAYGKEK